MKNMEPYQMIKKLVEERDLALAIVESQQALIDKLTAKLKEQRWIPVTIRETTEEDGVNRAECPFMLDCPLPDDDERILVCTISGYVTEDEFYRDGCECYLDSGRDWDEVAAWMPLPEPYKDGE